MSERQINKIIKQTVENFYSTEWNFKDFLTEDDVRCRLFKSLYLALEPFPKASVHSEIRWYGNRYNNEDETKLKYRSDIVIIDRDDLEVHSCDKFKLPSKGFGFDKFFAIIEIKLRRPNDLSSDTAFTNLLQADIDKLKELNKRTNLDEKQKLFYLIAFDKRTNKKRIVELTNQIDTSEALISSNTSLINIFEQKKDKIAKVWGE